MNFLIGLLWIGVFVYILGSTADDKSHLNHYVKSSFGIIIGFIGTIIIGRYLM